MTNAINWIKDRTVTVADDPLLVDGITYEVRRETFAGYLPRGMVRAVAKAKVESTDTVNETIFVNIKTGFAEYQRTTYMPSA